MYSLCEHNSNALQNAFAASVIDLVLSSTISTIPVLVRSHPRGSNRSPEFLNSSQSICPTHNLQRLFDHHWKTRLTALVPEKNDKLYIYIRETIYRLNAYAKTKTNTHSNVFAPHDRMRQRIPQLYDTVETSREKLGQRWMRTQRPQFVGVAQDGRAKAH